MSDDTGYVGTDSSIASTDVAALFEGAKFFSPAVGNKNRSPLVGWLTGLLERNGPVSLRRVETLPAQTSCVATCVIGSGPALTDLPPSGDEFELAIRHLERLQGSPFGAVYPLAAATVSALAPVAVASQLQVPLLDVDGMGSTYALIHHTAMYLGGMSPTPLVALGPTGESVTIEVDAAPRVDRMLRAVVDTLGGWAALAAYPTTTGTLQHAVLHGMVSRLLNVGRVLLQHAEPDVLINRLGAITGSRRIGRARIAELEHLSRPTHGAVPAHPTSIVANEIGGQGRQFRMELRSEIIAVFADGVLAAGAPDLTCLLDVSRGELAALDSIQIGDVVDILATHADAMWYAPDGMEMVGLRSHNIPLAHPRQLT